MPRTGSEGGRICATNDTFDALAPDVEVRPEHIHSLNVIKTKESADATRKAHRCCLKLLMHWWMTNYPDYFEVGTQVLSREERGDPMKFYHTCDRDIV